MGIESCPQCRRGFLLPEPGGKRCCDCIYRVESINANHSSPVHAASTGAPASTSRQSQKESPVDTGWFDQHEKILGRSCLSTVRSILESLTPPFIQQSEECDKLGLKRPWFHDNPEYIHEMGSVIKYRDRTAWERLFGKRNVVEGIIAAMPPINQVAVRAILGLCDERTREDVSLMDCRLRWFRDTIARDQQYLAKLVPLIRLREKQVRTRWTSPSIHSSLFFPFVFNPLWTMDSPDKVQGQLKRAGHIVDEAYKALTPAIQFYLGEHFPRPVKKALLESIIRLSFPTQRDAARLGAALFGIADPDRTPVDSADLLQTHFDR